MKISLVLLVGVLAVARAATGRYDVGTEGPVDFPATHPSILESSSVPGIRDNKQGQHSQDLQVTGSPAPHDFQRDSNLFLSHNLGTPASTTIASKSTSVKGQFNKISSQHPQAFFNDKQNSPKQQQFVDGRQQHSGQIPFSYNDNQRASNEQRFFNAEQQFPNQEQFLNDRQQQEQFYNDQQQQQQLFNDQQQQQFYNDQQQQQFYNDQQQQQQQRFYNDQQQQQQFFGEKQQKSAQQQFFSEQQSPIQQQFYNDKQQSLNQQHQFYNDKQQSMNQQQQFYNDKQQSMNQQQFYNDKQQAIVQQQPRDQREMYNVQTAGITGQEINSKTLIQNVVSQKGQVKGEEPSIQIHSVSKGAVQLSAFDNRAQPLVVPQSSAMHSSSVVVSGLKNMPLLPAMVYNGGAVPVSHAAVYSRDPLYKGGAAMRQHLQTPFVRYVYSHVL